MKTITISVDDETFGRFQARAEAAGISVEDWAMARLGDAVPKPVLAMPSGNDCASRGASCKLALTLGPKPEAKNCAPPPN